MGKGEAFGKGDTFVLGSVGLEGRGLRGQLMVRDAPV
jgi:hypothetical protein